MVCTENNEFGVTENVAGEGILWIGDILYQVEKIKAGSFQCQLAKHCFFN